MPADVIEQLRMLREVLDVHAPPVTLDDLRRTPPMIQLESESAEVIRSDVVNYTEPGNRWTKRALAVAAVLVVIVGLAVLSRQDRAPTRPGSTVVPLLHPETTPTVVETLGSLPEVAQSVPSTTSKPDTTAATTIPVAERAPVAIGESVMLGAKPQLESAGFVVDAAESRRASDVSELLSALRSDGRLGNTVVIHIGTNGEVTDEDLAAIMTNLPPEEVASVWFLTDYADRPWIAANNQRIIALPNSYPNVHVGYWHLFATTLPGTASDGVHLATNEAKQTYTDLITTWTDVTQ